jgi:hypothetical protein
MTPDEIVALFIRAQELLHIVDNRMTLLPLRDMNTLAALCGLVAEQPEDTPAQCALVRLAAATAAVLTTAVVGWPGQRRNRGSVAHSPQRARGATILIATFSACRGLVP